MSEQPTPPRQGVDDIEEVLDELTLQPGTPEQVNPSVPNLVHGGHDFAYGVRPTDQLNTPPHRAHSRGDDIDNEEDRGGHYASRPIQRLPQTPRSRPPTRDAQNEYPSSACIFIANLLKPRSDEELHDALQEAFSTFGTVFIKVRRDPIDMPFAFAQFTNDEDAQNALINGRGIRIYDRAVRLEPPRAAQFSHFITRHDGRDMTAQEASTVMSQLGRVSNVTVLDNNRSEALNTHGTSFAIRFEMWNGGRDVIGHFRDDPTYRAGSLMDNTRPPTRPAPRYNNPSTYRATPRHGPFTAERDARTVWISNLDPATTDEELEHLVAQVGQLENFTIKPARVYGERDATGRSHTTRAFAFVEFRTEEQARNAIEQLNGTEGPRGVTIQVEAKRINPRYNNSQSSLRQRYVYDNYETPTRYEDERSSESMRRHTDRPRNDRGDRNEGARTQPATQPRVRHDSPVHTTAPASYIGPDPSISDYTPAPAFPTMPTVPYQGPYQMPGFAPGYQFPMGMPMGNMGYNVFGGPAYGPMYHPYAAPPFALGGFAPPSDPFQGPTVTQSEPVGATEEERKEEEKEE